MNKEFIYEEERESIDKYLSRAARWMDSVRTRDVIRTQWCKKRLEIAGGVVVATSSITKILNFRDTLWSIFFSRTILTSH